MQKMNYDDLQNIDINATNKLLIYIDSLMDIHKLYGEINENFHFFKDESSRLAFNSWLTMDYLKKDGNTFIEDFLKVVPSTLNQLERNVLRGKSNSFISLLEIIRVEDEYITVKDVLNNMDYKLWEPKLRGLMKEGEVFLARVGKSLDNYRFIGDINYLPISVKPIFMESLLVDFNNMRKKDTQLDIKGYLKTHTLNIYKVYENAILNVDDLEYDEDYLLFYQLEEFENFLSAKLSPIKVKNHMQNLMNLYEYKLEDSNMNIKDILLHDLKAFFKKCLNDEFILTMEEFNSYLNTLKIYLDFLSSIDKKYINAYKEILDISKNRFKYIKYMKSQSKVFNVDPSLVSIIGKLLDNDMMILLKDFDSFLSTIDEVNPKLTQKNKFINRKDLYNINEDFRLQSYPLSKAPNQEDYPLIELFYFASLNLNLSEIIGNKLYLKDNINYFFRLKDEEKYSLLCEYVLNGDFTEDKFPGENIKLLDDFYVDFRTFIYGLKYLRKYPSLFQQLDFLGILEYHKNSHSTITPLGKNVVNYLIRDKSRDKKSNLVYLESLKKT